jgi:HEAT repeat protein
MRRDAGIGLLAAVALLAGCFQAEAPRPAAQSPRADTGTSSSARAQAVMELAEENGARAVPELTSIALHDPDATVRREAIYSLADVGDTADKAVIGQALTDPDPRVRKAAIEVLTGLGDDDSASMLATALNDADPRIRMDAVDALGEVGGPTAALALQQAVNDSDPGVREAASEVLEELGTDQP